MASEGPGQVARADLEAVHKALSKVQAIIEFELDGMIVTANEKFLEVFGYEFAEIVGKHHRIFCEPGYAGSDEYAQFWRLLGQGNAHEAELKRLGKGGREVWLQASYNPILDAAGAPVRIVKFAVDVTDTKRQTAEYEGKIQAIERRSAASSSRLTTPLRTSSCRH